MDGEARLHHKQEQSRMRWTLDLDKIFKDLIVGQIQQGNGPNNILDKKTWSTICREFNKKTGLNFNSNQLRKDFDVFQTRFHSMKSPVNQNKFPAYDSCGMRHDRSHKIEKQKTALYMIRCALYMLNLVITNSWISLSELLRRIPISSLEEGPEIVRDFGMMRPAKQIASPVGFRNAERKKKQPCSGKDGKETLDSMARAMLDMIAS